MDLLQDNREISAVWYEPDGEYAVGKNGIEKIEVYGEPGEYCFKPWFKIYRHGVVDQRINAQFIAGVSYKPDQKEGA